MLFAVLMCTVVLYEMPWVLTLVKTGWSSLPPTLGADEMLYLNLTAIRSNFYGEVVNPWYGDVVPTIDVPHLRFPITFLLFRFIHAVFRSWTGAMLVWAGVWAALTFVAAVFCINSLFPRGKLWLTLIASFSLLVMQPPLTYLAEFRHSPSVAGFLDLHLPYMRFAIPQVTLPLALAYLGLQARALRSGSKWHLAGMVLLQSAVCASFPYFLPVLAIGTILTIGITKLSRRATDLSWRAIFVFGGICGLLDIAYLLLTGIGKSHANVQFIPQFRPEMIIPAMRPFVFQLAILAGLAMSSGASLPARATVSGLALSNALFALSDVFFSPKAQILDHPYYIIALTTWLPLLVFIWAFLEKLNSLRLRTALFGFVTLTAVWEGFATYRSLLPVNVRQTAALAEVKKLSLRDRDLVVAPAQFTDDFSSWIPLISDAKILYTSDGENILSAAQTQTEQAFRQAVYLSMQGMNPDSLASATANDSREPQLTPLVQQGDRGYQRSPLYTDRIRARSLVRERLAPLLASFDAEPSLVRNFLKGYERIIVLDDTNKPVFDAKVFSQLIDVHSAYEENGIRIWICSPKFG
jgi:hypothetical protein